ncbi:MAG: hypothetical protein ACHQVK_05145 [Candidatus Paceibacterales bacterium]
MKAAISYIFTKAGKSANYKKLIAGILLFVLAALSGTVQAQAYCGKSIRNVQIEQQNRIYNDIASGALTPKEAARLEYQQARIHRQIRTARKRGYLLPCERAHIKTEQARASAYIYALKHNAQYR